MDYSDYQWYPYAGEWYSDPNHTDAYEWRGDGNYRAPTGAFTGRRTNYQPFGVLDFSQAPNDQYQNFGLPYAIDNNSRFRVFEPMREMELYNSLPNRGPPIPEEGYGYYPELAGPNPDRYAEIARPWGQYGATFPWLGWVDRDSRVWNQYHVTLLREYYQEGEEYHLPWGTEPGVHMTEDLQRARMEVPWDPLWEYDDGYRGR